MIKKEIIEKVKEGIDIVELISEYVPIKKQGRRYRGLCPFHLEKNPSFYVDPERQIFHCFGCGEGGTALSFLIKYEKITFPEAVKILAERTGIKLEEERESKERGGIYEALEFAAELFTSYLYYYPKPLQYLKARGITPETQKRFRLGYSPGNRLLFKEAKKKGFSKEILIKAGLCIERDGVEEDFFFQRLMFPIFSPGGKIIGFGGRTLEEGVEPKYLNSPESAVFKKGENLYGFYQAKRELRENKPILVEGYFDLLSLASAGINNCLAPLGTAFTVAQALLIKRYNQDLYITFDGDLQGREATKKAIPIALKAGLNPLIITLPDGDDPDKFIREKGKMSFLNLLSAAKDFIDFTIQDKDLSSITGRREVIQNLQGIIQEIADPVLREISIKKAAEVLGVRPEIFYMKERQKTKGEERKISLGTKERKLLSYIIISPEYARLCQTTLPIAAFPPDYHKILTQLYDLSEKDFTVSELCDCLEDEKDRNLVAALSFREEKLPSREEFQDLLKRVLADFLKKPAEKDWDKLKEFFEVKKDLSIKKGGSD